MESEASSVNEDPVASVSKEVDCEIRVSSPVSEVEEFLSGQEEPDDELQHAADAEKENSEDAFPESILRKDEGGIGGTDDHDAKSYFRLAADLNYVLSGPDLQIADKSVLDEKDLLPEELGTSGNLDEVSDADTQLKVFSSEDLGEETALRDDPVLGGVDAATQVAVEFENSGALEDNDNVMAKDSGADGVLSGNGGDGEAVLSNQSSSHILESRYPEKEKGFAESENLTSKEEIQIMVQENGDVLGADSGGITGVTLAGNQQLHASEVQQIQGHDSAETREIAMNVEKEESNDRVDAIEQDFPEMQVDFSDSMLADTSPEDEENVAIMDEHLHSVEFPHPDSSQVAPVVGPSGVIDAGEAEKNGEEKDDEEDNNDNDAEMDVTQIMKNLEHDLMDGQIVSDSEEELEISGESQVKEFLDPETLTALLKAATSASSDGTITISPVNRPAGLGSSIPSLKPNTNRSIRPTLLRASDVVQSTQEENPGDEEDKKLQDNVDQIRVKFLRLVNRLGHSPEDRVSAQVLYRLGLAEGIKRGKQLNRGHSSLENSKRKALMLEEQDRENLDFSCHILMIGKTGVGKSATINSIFNEEKVSTNAFEASTKSIKPILGLVDGIKLRVTDTPGLKPSVMDQTVNKRILESIKKYTKRFPPDIVLYVDRLDTQTWDFNDLPLLRSVSSILGPSVWFNAIVALTHSATAPPDGPTGTPLSYEGFIDQRSRIVQHAIRQAAGDMRLMNPVALVENHPLCRKNREGHRILPNGLSWRQQLLLLCFSSKILSEANSLLKLQEPSPAKLFGFRVRSAPLPFLLSSLLQSKAHPKVDGDGGDSDIDLGESSDSDVEEGDDYDQLPPFKPLRKAQLAKLSKEQRSAYYDEYDYRVKLLQKKQLKEMKKMKKASQREDTQPDDFDQDGASSAVPVPLPDMVLPPSFDSENPVHRFRFLEPTSQLLTRPVLDSHGWDHDCGYDGVSLEDNLSLLNRFPAGFTLQLTKDKKEFNVHFDSSVSAKHGDSGSTMAGFDIQSVGKQLAYILRGESKFRTFRNNKTAAGVSLTFLGEHVATGIKLEDHLLGGNWFELVGATGVVRAQGDMAYGANMELRVRDKEFPISQDMSTLGLSLMRWRGDMALGANLQSQVAMGRGSKVAVRVGLNNKRSGQITIRTSTCDQLQLALVGVLPIATYIYRSFLATESY